MAISTTYVRDGKIEASFGCQRTMQILYTPYYCLVGDNVSPDFLQLWIKIRKDRHPTYEATWTQWGREHYNGPQPLRFVDTHDMRLCSRPWFQPAVHVAELCTGRQPTLAKSLAISRTKTRQDQATGVRDRRSAASSAVGLGRESLSMSVGVGVSRT